MVDDLIGDAFAEFDRLPNVTHSLLEVGKFCSLELLPIFKRLADRFAQFMGFLQRIRIGFSCSKPKSDAIE